MQKIDEKIVTATWKEVANFDEKHAKQEMIKLGDRQTDLVAFVTTLMDDLSTEAIELGIYIFYVVYRMFEKSSKDKLKRVSANKIISAYQRNEAILLKLDGAHERFFERIGELESAKQSNVLRYVLEAIMESDEGVDPVFLSEAEIGSLYLILKTVIDVLDKILTKSSP